jgi:predicted nucleotidyltransferase component of viral defense system
MIPKAYVIEWQRFAPWRTFSQVEQDLIICKTLVELFDHQLIADNLAFRGGTALYKLYLEPSRYSEDIDLVQISPGPIGQLLDAVQEKLNPWLGIPKRSLSEGRAVLIYRIQSEDGLPMRLKIEINTREHFCLQGYIKKKFAINSRWYSGSVSILTYNLDELLGTKLRALYQRKKGRDLFDIWKACSSAKVNPRQIIKCFLYYMSQEGHKVSRAEFEKNLSDKFLDPGFNSDIRVLLADESGWNYQEARSYIMTEIIPLLPGEAWKRPVK